MMRRLLLWSGLILLALLSCPATARLKLYEGRIVFVEEGDDTIGVQSWEVEGVASVEIGSDETSPAFFFDCNTTANDGSEIVWAREVVPIDKTQTSIENGKRLEFGKPDPEDLGVYICVDQATGEQVSLNITSSNPAVCAVEDTKAVVLGQSLDLEVYVSGIPPVISSWIKWFGPDGNELTDTNATFQDNKRRLVLNNVQNSSAGIYKCQVSIPVAPLLSLFLTSSDTIELEIYLPSVITQDPQSHIGVEERSEVILSCTATGHPLPVISWEREGGELPVSQMSSSESNGMVVSTLTIGTVRYLDMGRYRCSADNTETAVVYSQYAELSVIPSLQLKAYIDNVPINFTDLLFTTENSRVRVECFGSGTLQWTSLTGVEIPSNSSQNQIYQEPDHSRTVQTLYIESFSDDVLSVYTCATDLLDSTSNPVQAAVFITNSNPAVYIPEETLYALEDTSVTITANIFAHPIDDSIQWFHEGSLVDPLTDTRFSINNDRRELHINNVEESVLGTYEVVASIGNYSATDSVTVEIPDPPMAFVSPVGEATADIGEPVDFQCAGGGGGILAVVWNLDGDQDLPEGVRQSGNDLVIDSAATSLAGTYVCTVENLVGTATASVTLRVNHPPSAVVSSFQQSSSTTLSLTFMAGDTTPLFTCTASGYPSPSITWVYEGVFSSFHVNGLPDDVILADASREMEVRELHWQRTLLYTDSGMYKCTASNDYGDHEVTLDLLVQVHPIINSIYPAELVVEGESPSSELTAFSVPNGYAGDIVTCHGFAWPIPNIEWTRVGGPLPLGVSFDVSENAGGVTVARLSVDDSFSASATGMYMCTVSYKDDPGVAVSEIIEILEGSTTTTPAPCNVRSTSVNFQLRVLTTSCQQWDASLIEHIEDSFPEELSAIIEDDCQCSVGSGTIVVDSLRCSGDPSKPGASLFRGTIETDSVAQTEQVYCTLLNLQQRGALVNVNGNLRKFDSNCSLGVDSFTAEECVAMNTGSSFDVKLIIYIVAPVVGTLVVVVILMLICMISKSGRRGKATINRSQELPMNNNHPYSDNTRFYGSAAVSPSPNAEAAQRTSRSTEQSLMFDDLAYQASIDHNPHLQYNDPSPEHGRGLPTSASKDQLLEMVDAGNSPSSPSPNATLTTTVQTQVQPYQLPVISSGSISRVGLSSVSGSHSHGSHASATNPMFVVNTASDATVASASSSNQSPSPYATAYAIRTLAAARATSPTPYATYNPPVPALPPLPPLIEKEDSPILLPSNPSRRGPSVSSHLGVSNASVDSVTKLSLAATPAPSVPYSEDLPPYTSRPTSSIAENRRPAPSGGSPNVASGRPWYQADSDLSISSNSRQDDINPYAITRNSAIPYSNATSRSSLPSSSRGGSLSHVNNGAPPRTPPVQPAQQTQLQQLPPQPYAQPIVRSSLSTLSTVQGNRTFEMVTV